MFGDHAPILSVPLSNPKRKKRGFKFENWWLFESDFQEVSKKIWSQFSHLPFHKRTKQLGHHLHVWSKRNKSSLKIQLKHIESELANMQALPIYCRNFALEDTLIQSYEFTQNKISEYYRQRCKKEWILRGDRNTSFFHKNVIKRRRKNRINSTTNAQGNTVTSDEDIAYCFIEYFGNLFRSTL